MARIGIGVTTYKRPDHFKLWMRQINKYLPEDHVLHIAKDVPRKGIAYRKNECIYALKECDYIFLYDDDCFPIKEGWVELFINEHLRTKNHHFLYLNHATHNHLYNIGGVEIYQECGGAFMFLTKEVVNRVGYMNAWYSFYGFEHASYTNRIHQAGLTPFGMYLHVKGSSEYICSLDSDLNTFDIAHVKSMPMREVKSQIELNRGVYIADIKRIYQPFTP